MINYTDIVSELNAELFNRGEEELSFTYLTTGYVDIILFADMVIWNSEDDSREWNEETQDYEPFEPYIKRIFNEQMGRLSKLKFKNDGVDPKYIGVPNICFSLIAPTDSREKIFAQQRIERGFDNSELWSLRDTIANFIVPRLEVYLELSAAVHDREPKLVKKIESFLLAMKLGARDEGAANWTKKEQKQIWKGLKNFRKVWYRLWI